MKTFLIAFFVFFAVNLSAQTTDLQYQAHTPSAVGAEISFSAYIADNSFNENSHLNTSAFWYVENETTPVNNGMINVLLKNIPDSVLTINQGNIFVYAYVNGISLGKLPLHKVPYAVSSRFSNRAELAQNAINSQRAEISDRANRADTSSVSFYALTAKLADSSNKSATSVHSNLADSSVKSKLASHSLKSDTSYISLESIYSRLSGYSSNSAKADIADSSFYSLNSGHAVHSDSALYANNSGHSIYSDTADYSLNAGHSATSGIASNLQDSVLLAKHFTNGSVKLNALDGGNSATIGSYAMRGANGIQWSVNPHHYTTSVSLYTQAPTSLSNTERYIVSRVAVDYNMVGITSPVMGQIVTIHNGSTANVVTLKGTTWDIDTMLDVVLLAGQSRTLWFNGLNWMVIQ
jgi:hypothetical protein